MSQPVKLPPNLEDLPKDILVYFLKRVAAERDDYANQLASKGSKKQKINHAAPINNYSFTPVAVPPAPAVFRFDVAGMKKRILKDATLKIKKTVHVNNGKPFTEIVEAVPNAEAAQDLMKGYAMKSDSSRMTKWLLKEGEVLDWLGIRNKPTIHPVANKINIYCTPGENPKIHVHAGIESVEVKWEKQSHALTLKFRTYVASIN